MDGQPVPLPRGTPAPAFSLPRSPYAVVSLADVRGRRAILAFYPGDWEPVSQQQLTLYQEHLATFSQLGAVLLAVSTDHVWCHGAFVRAVGLTYPLLADAQPHGAVTRAYGVYDEQAGVSARALFVLDEAGIIQWSHSCPTAINPGVDGILTALEALEALEALGAPEASPDSASLFPSAASLIGAPLPQGQLGDHRP